MKVSSLRKFSLVFLMDLYRFCTLIKYYFKNTVFCVSEVQSVGSDSS